MPYNAQLYKHVTPDDGLGADVLVPAANDGKVDVHYEYNWTLSERAVRDYVPYVELTEYKQILSSEISGFFYNLAGIVDNAQVAARTAGTTARGFTQVTEANTKRALNSISNLNIPSLSEGVLTANKFLDSLSDKVQNKIKAIDQATINRAKETDLTGEDPYNRNLNAYTGLYAIEPTGWKYIMPYLTSSNMASPNNKWGAPGGEAAAALGKMFGGETTPTAGSAGASTGGTATAGGDGAAGGGGPNIASLIGNMLGTAVRTGLAGVDLALAATPGAKLSETPQSFQGTDMDSITITFYLYNTQNFEQIKQNWEFCYLFTYQNLPNRKGVNLLDPPCLYKVLVPGYKQLPLCYVSSLKIENVGSVRLIDIDNDIEIDNRDLHISSPSIKMIPEAYKINITLSSVLYQARNIFSFAEDPSGKVTVSVTGE